VRSSPTQGRRTRCSVSTVVISLGDAEFAGSRRHPIAAGDDGFESDAAIAQRPSSSASHCSRQPPSIV